MKKEDKFVLIAKDGYPVEFIIGRPIINIIRLLLHTRKIMRYKNWIKSGGCNIDFGDRF